MNRRQLLHVLVSSAPYFLAGRTKIARAGMRQRLACAARSDQLTRYGAQLRRLPGIEIEDWLDPTFPERAEVAVPVLQEALAGYQGRILLSGPFIDLNPGSAERLVRKATRQRFQECYGFARAIGASEIIFLSSYLPLINLPFYDRGWLDQSVAFWSAYLEELDTQVIVSLCNTFEYHPDLMLKVVEAVNRPQFRLGFDLGHFLVYGREPLSEWLRKTAARTSSVYVHSNDGHVDTHDEPSRGVLTRQQMQRVVAAVGPDANVILKMNNKDSLERSVAWMEAS